MANVLVVGGAGYIGSSVTAWLLDHGHQVGVLDDLSTGHRELLLTDRFLHADMSDREKVLPWLKAESFDVAMLFAAKALVEESVASPEAYYQTNVVKLEQLLEMLNEVGTKRVVFSSSCTVFGDPEGAVLNEESPKQPVNPYGKQKLMMEQHIQSLTEKEQFQATILRYFNAAGADPELRVGEWHDHETHLIPNILQRAVGSQTTPIFLFGTDYPTHDGTCVRDYIHVRSLAQAHVQAMMNMLEDNSGDGAFWHYNLGTGRGYSVQEVINTVEKVVGKTLLVDRQPRRPGDAPILVANPEKATRELQFNPHEFSLEQIITDAWRWEQKLPKVKSGEA